MEHGEEEKKRRLYFKNLRKQQKKRRKERKREEERLRKDQERKRRFDELVANVRRKLSAGQDPAQEAHVLEDEIIDEELEDSTMRRPAKAVDPATDKRRVAGNYREIKPSSLIKLGTTIGAGSYGSCQLADYRGMTVAVKEFKGLGEGKRARERQLQNTLHEANIISSLGDHRGLPFLFGVQTKVAPYRLVLQFHGDKNRSLTLWRAARKIKLSNDEWMTVVTLIGDALQFVHSQGIIHNDLKANNVVLEKREDGFNPVIIDFGKSVKILAADSHKRTLPSQERGKYLSKYRHVAPELVSGGSPSIASDTYSFAKVIDFLCNEASKLKLTSSKLVLAKNCALGPDPTKRPPLVELFQTTKNDN